MFIQMQHAKKSYGKGEREVHALDDTELALEQGKIYVILGPSGSGKSTMLNMLGGLDSLDSGSITVDGKEISKLKSGELTKYRRSDVGFVFQFYNLIPDLTVKENIQVVSDIAKEPLPLDEVMQAVDIGKYKDRFPNELSGGQQQRVAIARAIIKNPKLLLCDELTGALDSKTSKNVLKFVEKVNAQFGTTVAIITHNEMIAGMADGVIRIKDGKVVANKVNETKIPADKLEL
ncbi:ABC transporter ATP-binding protein [Eubacterium sp. MSJ-33]|mgnify:FL=1|uniref:ABC transporter ATP-binding protein n=1 Tax=Eubacterium sp. MSJ-33 TaxID=2841528 RepID=UPI001C783E28|nr:ABC transporter ATP-binding protein [Eubacterium sp. MSJ-33]QWT53082.1 ABC transporter ATP-binding protein [Eubacterium sp. MSJ-33]